jgi:hypothetical protein
VISDEIAQRGFIHFMQDLGQFLAVGELRRKALPVDFTQCDHEYVAVLSGDLASCRGDDCSNLAVRSRIFLEWAILA